MHTFEELNSSNVFLHTQKRILIVHQDNTVNVAENHGDCWIDGSLNTHRFYWDECNVYLIPKYNDTKRTY